MLSVSIQTVAPHDSGLSGLYTIRQGPLIETSCAYRFPLYVLHVRTGLRSPVLRFSPDNMLVNVDYGFHLAPSIVHIKPSHDHPE